MVKKVLHFCSFQDTNLQYYQFSSIVCTIIDEFAHSKIICKTNFYVLGEDWEDPDPDPIFIMSVPDHCDQKITDPGPDH
jgi:hypothetical protein